MLKILHHRRGRRFASYSLPRSPLDLACTALVPLLCFTSGCQGTRPDPRTSVAQSPALAVSTASLARGQVGTDYQASLSAVGGAAPYHWLLSAGTLPAGLTLIGSTGAISGTPMAGASSIPLTFAVTDSSSPAKSASASLTLTIAPVPLVITTTALASGKVATAYSATLSATGGATPYHWGVTSGSLPAGLALNAITGVIDGTPQATANSAPLTFTLTDSGTPAQTQSVGLNMTLAPSGISVAVSPLRAGLAVGQPLSLTAASNDYAVMWSVAGTSCSGSACGMFSSAFTFNGAPVTYTPNAAGFHTITATSFSDKTISASVSIAATDLDGVATYHGNSARTGANTREYVLTPANVNASTFGKLFSCAVDGAVYAQPLWVPNLTIGSTKHNVIFVATQHDSLYAFDADANGTPCLPLWHASLIDPAHGGLPGESAVPWTLLGGPLGTIEPEVGVTGTPVIDLTADTLYVVSKSAVVSGNAFYQRLHAIDLTTGSEKASGPVTIAATYPGGGDGGTTITFVPRQQNQRAGLALANGVVYVAWGSHEDALPYYGWIMGYNASNLAQVSVFSDTPNTGMGGIWMSGGAPAIDSEGNLYLATGNGGFDASNASPPNNDYGDSLLQLSPGLTVQQYFTPSDQQIDDAQDADFGSGGAAVLIDLPPNGNNPTHLVIAGGKDGNLYLLNRDHLGGLGDSNAWQQVAIPNSIFATGAFWNSTFYLPTVAHTMQAYSLSSSTGKLTPAVNASAPESGFASATPTVSSMPDNSNGIVWVLNNSGFCTHSSKFCGPPVLHAFDANNLANELWNSTQGTGNTPGNAVKFTVPTVANGRVYIGTRGNNTGGDDSSTSIPGELDVYGLLPNQGP